MHVHPGLLGQDLRPRRVRRDMRRVWRRDAVLQQRAGMRGAMHATVHGPGVRPRRVWRELRLLRDGEDVRLDGEMRAGRVALFASGLP